VADFIDFEKNCIDPLAQQLILAAIDLTISMHKAITVPAGLINKTPENIKTIREAIYKTPLCGMAQPKAPLPPRTTQAATWTEPIPEKKATVVAPATGRTRPPEWGRVRFDAPGQLKGREFANLGELATRLGFTTRGAATQIEAFKWAGFEVKSADGGPPEKGKLQVVTKIPGVDIPQKMRITIPGVGTAPTSTAKEEAPAKIGPPRVAVKDTAGKIVRWEDEWGRPVPPDQWPGAEAAARKSTVEALINQLPKKSRPTCAMPWFTCRSRCRLTLSPGC